MNARLFALLAIFSLCTLVALPSPALAQQIDVPISVDSATLHAKGKLVSVQVSFICPVTGHYDLAVDLKQPADGHLGFEGEGREGGSCREGETVTESVWVHAGKDPRFTVGTAFAFVFWSMPGTVLYTGIWAKDVHLTA